MRIGPVATSCIAAACVVASGSVYGQAAPVPVVTTPEPPPLVISVAPRAPEDDFAELPDIDVPDVLMARLGQGGTLERYVADIVGTLRSSDRDGNGLDRGDIELIASTAQAQARARAAQDVVARDLDGDLKVTRAEVERTLRQSEARARTAEANRFLDRYDTDGNGIVTLAEAIRSVSDDEVRSDPQPEALLALDPNGDGTLTAAELAPLAEAAFRRFDTDGDGTISADEGALVSKYKRLASLRSQVAACPLPKVPAGAELIVYGAYDGQAISSTVVGGQDQETNVTQLEIEPGDKPLYIVLTSYESMIWQVTGDTARVAQLVANAWAGAKEGELGKKDAGPSRIVAPGPERRTHTPSAVGVTGLPAGKVTIADKECWGHFYRTEKGEAQSSLALIQRNLGRKPDAVFGNYSALRVALPSGEVANPPRDVVPAPAGFEARMWQDARRYWPGGLVAVAPKAVVARVKVEPYLVLPSQMGLSQLVGSGAAQYIDGRTFRIVKPIAHLPPSMGGAHLATLILAKGVPLPPGDPVHACVLSEGSETPLVAGPVCSTRREPIGESARP